MRRGKNCSVIENVIIVNAEFQKTLMRYDLFYSYVIYF